ncbi:MAG: hypothetical protein V4633_05810 [Pseudomonadota bacterium]
MAPTRYIVRARAEGSALDDFIASINLDPALELVDVIGPPGHPHTAVVAVAQDMAPAFEQRFHNSPHLMIERDRPLSLFPGTDATDRSERKANG